jgi:sensor histidine kinase regulating citrate/malate metabolism
VVAQSSKSSTAKKAAQKAFNIGKILAKNKTVQAALPPQARLTLAALQSDDAKKIFQQLHW